jgi:hypothetical protein
MPISSISHITFIVRDVARMAHRHAGAAAAPLHRVIRQPPGECSRVA